MGSVIKEDTKGERSAALTETGKGGLLSQGYLRDAPAGAYVGEGETVAFVLTDDESGVERERDGERTTISPGKGYRAITVVTDRRVIVLVGDAGDGGDKRVTLPLVEVIDVCAAAGALVLEMSSGVTWRCQADAVGVEDVAAYVAVATAAWDDVEGALDAVKRSIVSATARRDEGDYDEALAAIGAARDGVRNAQHRAAAFEVEWPGTALAHRIGSVRDRCLTTAAEVHVGHARSLVDDGESHWREGQYERAHDAFDAARESYQAVAVMASRHRRVVEDVDEALDRLDHRVERLDDAPLRRAIDADRRANDLDQGHEALDALAEARERYDTVLDLDPDADERRFAGDRDRIREQREDVTDRYVETARSVGTDALAAGEWYCGSGQLSLAVEELERAATFFDHGLTVASTERPAVAEELRCALKRSRELLEEAREDLVDDESSIREAADDGRGDRDGDREDGDGDLADRDNDRDEGDGNLDDDEDRRDGGDVAMDAVDESSVDSGTAGEERMNGTAEIMDPAVDEIDEVEAALRDLAPPEFDRLVTAVVEAMGWRPESTASAAVDYLARREDATSGTLAIVTFPNEDGEAMTPETIRECATLATSVPGVDDVMIVTTRPLPAAAMDVVREEDLRVLDVEYLASVLAGPDAADVGTVVPTAGD